MMALTGLGQKDLAGVVETLGFVGDDKGQYRRSRKPRRNKKTKRNTKAAAAQSSPFAALLDLQFKTGTA